MADDELNEQVVRLMKSTLSQQTIQAARDRPDSSRLQEAVDTILQKKSVREQLIPASRGSANNTRKSKFNLKSYSQVLVKLLKEGHTFLPAIKVDFRRTAKSADRWANRMAKSKSVEIEPEAWRHGPPPNLVP